jgi:hypothetical protein
MPFGSFVVRRDFIDERAFGKYLGTCHAYTGVVWEMLAEKFVGVGSVTVRCMEESTVVLRGGEKSWRDYKARIYLYEIPAWFGRLPSLYAEEAGRIRDGYLKIYGSLVSLLGFRRSGQLTPGNCRKYMTYFGEAEQRKAAIVSCIPSPIASVIRFFVKTFAGLRS